MKMMTLCIIFKDSYVLLGMKKRGFGVGRWNGFGGKVQEGESVEEATRREVWEEAGVAVSGLKKHGVLLFWLAAAPQDPLQVYLFKTNTFTGEPVETEEMRPQWFRRDALPFHAMWADDSYWFPLLLENKLFRGEFHFDKYDKVIHYTLEEIDEL